MITDKSGQYSEEGVTPGPEPRNLLLMVGSFLQRQHCEALGSASCKVSAVGEQS